VSVLVLLVLSVAWSLLWWLIHWSPIRSLAPNVVAGVIDAILALLVIDQLVRWELRRREREQRQHALQELFFAVSEAYAGFWMFWYEAKESTRNDPAFAVLRRPSPLTVTTGDVLGALPELLKRQDLASPVTGRKAYASLAEHFGIGLRRRFNKLQMWLLQYSPLFENDFVGKVVWFAEQLEALAEAMENINRYILREHPTPPVLAYALTELDEDSVRHRVEKLADFATVYVAICREHGVKVDWDDLYL